MNRFSTDRYLSGLSDLGDKYSFSSRSKSPYRAKSPYRSTSSLSHNSSSSNPLKVDTDFFNQLNKSLGAHDASFMSKDDNASSVKSGAKYSKYMADSDDSDCKGSKFSLSKSDFNVDKLNRDYSGTKYKFGNDNGDSDYDYNNNNNSTYRYSTNIPSGKVACASGSDDSEYEFSSPYLRKVTEKGEDQLSEASSVSSDTSMSEYIHCKSFCPGSSSHSKLFHGLRSSPSFSSPTPSSNPSYIHQQYHDLSGTGSDLDAQDVRFVPIACIQDQQAIRAAEFHPNGKYYAVGSNSKMLRVCRYSSQDKNNNNAAESSYVDIPEPDIMYSRQRYHKGSIYCLTWNKLGNLLATGSNDKTIKLVAFNQDTETFHNKESELTVHGGTVRDLCFMDDLTNGSSLLLSGGAGDCKIYITDCETNTTFISLSGHSGAILSLYTWGGAMFVSGSQDRTIRFWDLRSNSCINLVTCPTISRNKPGGAVASVSVDPSGKLLVSGYEDSTCMLYDIRGGRVIQTFHPHSSDIRTIRFSNKAYYLLSGGYDNKIVLTDLQGDLTQPLKSVVVAEHQDKVIQSRWHPSDFTFLSTSADKSAILWALPD